MIPSQLKFAVPVLLLLMPSVSAHAQATNSVKCSDGTIVTISVSGGKCSIDASKWVYCSNGSNAAAGGCDSSGNAKCADNSSGTGSCTMKMVHIPGGNTPAVSSGALRSKSSGAAVSGGVKGPTAPTVNPALNNSGPLGSNGGTGSATTAGSKAKLPASGTTTLGR